MFDHISSAGALKLFIRDSAHLKATDLTLSSLVMCNTLNILQEKQMCQVSEEIRKNIRYILNKDKA